MIEVTCWPLLSIAKISCNPLVYNLECVANLAVPLPLLLRPCNPDLPSSDISLCTHMTSLKLSATSTPKDMNTASSLNTPISLLWAHQLRREHNALVSRIEELATTANTTANAVLPLQLKKISAQADKADARAASVEVANSKLRREVEELRAQVEQREEELGNLQAVLEKWKEKVKGCEKNVLDLKGKLAALDEDTKKRLAEVTQHTDDGFCDNDNKITQLVKWVTELGKTAEEVSNAVSLVKDDLEKQKQRPKGMRPSPKPRRNVRRLIDTLQAQKARIQLQSLL